MKAYILSLTLLLLALPVRAATLAGAILNSTDTTGTNARPSRITVSPVAAGTNLMAGAIAVTNNLSVGNNASVIGTLAVTGQITNSALTASTLVYSTATKVLGSITLGDAGDVLTSNGEGIVPTFQPPTAGGDTIWTNNAGTISATFSGFTPITIDTNGVVITKQQIGSTFYVGGDNGDDWGEYVPPNIDTTDQEFLEGDFIGYEAGSSSTISNYTAISIHGSLAGYSADIRDGSDMNLFGEKAGKGGHFSGDFIDIFGQEAGENSTIQNGSHHISIFGLDAFESGTIDNSYYIQMGALTSFLTYITNCNRLDFRGILSGSGSYVNSSYIEANGLEALSGAALTNSTEVVAIGSKAGQNLAGTFSHVVMIGPGSTVTNNNDFVFGDTANNYFLPGPTANFGGVITLAGTTNQITFGATNTAPVSSAAPTKWISVQVAGESAVYRLPLYE